MDKSFAGDLFGKTFWYNVFFMKIRYNQEMFLFLHFLIINYWRSKKKNNNMSWYKLIIDVDYWPSDPGSSSHYCERTQLLLSDLKAGQSVSYDDPSDILPAITLVGIDEKGVTLQASGTTVRLPDFWGSRFSKLAEAGRNYTNFQLWAGVEEAIDITHDLKFLRIFSKNSRIMSLTSADIEVLSGSDDPYTSSAQIQC